MGAGIDAVLVVAALIAACQTVVGMAKGTSLPAGCSCSQLRCLAGLFSRRLGLGAACRQPDGRRCPRGSWLLRPKAVGLYITHVGATVALMLGVPVL